jgi:hypothetical protein
MQISTIKEELNRVLIKTNFEEHENKKYYALTREDMIRLCIKLIKLIERVDNEGNYRKTKNLY